HCEHLARSRHLSAPPTRRSSDLGVSAAGLAMRRTAPSQEITVAHLEKRQRDLETQITRHDTRLGEMERSGLATASDVRSNREQIDRKSTRLNASHVKNPYADPCS